MSRRFCDEPLMEIRRALEAALTRPGAEIVFEAPHPDLSVTAFDGEPREGRRLRSLGAWVGLAESLGAALSVPTPLEGGWARFQMRRLDPQDSWHKTARPGGHQEKYGADTEFARTDKFEDPAFLRSWLDALDFLALPEGARVLSIGCHTGAELAFFEHIRAPEALTRMELVGVDHSESAIAEARRRHAARPYRFEVRDLAALDDPRGGLPEGRFDLILAINVLHSPALPGREIFKVMVRDHLTPSGRLLLGFPNSRYVDHRLMYGAAVKHARGPELSVVLADLAFHRRYLHQHRFKTLVTGKNTILLAGRRLVRAG